MSIYKIAIVLVILYFIYRNFIHCWLFGHSWSNYLDPLISLTRTCKNCSRKQVLKIGSGYVDR